MDQLRRAAAAPLLTLTAVVLLLMGAVLVVGGVWLAALGGSLYYLIAGMTLLLIAWLLWTRRAAALWVYAALLLATIVWAVWEAGLDFWSLAPRGDVLVPIGIWLLLPFVISHLSPGWRAARLGLLAVLVISGVVLALSLRTDGFDVAGTLPQANAEAVVSADGQAASVDWTAYGATGAGTRYSDLNEINKNNVKDLKLAWEFQTGDRKGPDDPDEFTNEATPLKIGDLLYTCSPHQIVFALDAATGKLRWKFDPQIQHNKNFQHMSCRGVAYHETTPGAHGRWCSRTERMPETNLPAHG
jgi:quinoprotein glucose dehydrogenase